MFELKLVSSTLTCFFRKNFHESYAPTQLSNIPSQFIPTSSSTLYFLRVYIFDNSILSIEKVSFLMHIHDSVCLIEMWFCYVEYKKSSRYGRLWQNDPTERNDHVRFSADWLWQQSQHWASNMQRVAKNSLREKSSKSAQFGLWSHKIFFATLRSKVSVLYRILKTLYLICQTIYRHIGKKVN